MQYEEFVSRLDDVLTPGHQFPNPGGGTSTVKSLVRGEAHDNLYYVRGHSTMHVRLRDLYDAFMNFRGRTCATSDLRQFRPPVFDPAAKGHSCNCTLFLLLLHDAGLADAIEGTGVRGNVFRSTILWGETS